MEMERAAKVKWPLQTIRKNYSSGRRHGLIPGGLFLKVLPCKNGTCLKGTVGKNIKTLCATQRGRAAPPGEGNGMPNIGLTYNVVVMPLVHRLVSRVVVYHYNPPRVGGGSSHCVLFGVFVWDWAITRSSKRLKRVIMATILHVENSSIKHPDIYEHVIYIV